MLCDAPQREADHAGADGGVALPVDEDEAAQVPVLGIGREGIRRSSASLTVPIALSASVLAGRASSVLTSIWCSISVTVAPQVRAPIFSR